MRTRIAPSPTGHFHIGNARTALFNYLFAKRHGGSFILRIEDTDRERSKKEFEDEIFESLGWLGIQPDECPTRGGEYGPYRQSERLASYTSCLERLLQEGKAFYCSHSEAELEAERKSFMVAGKPPVHRCNHRDGGREKGIIRFRTDGGRTIRFTDLIRGEIAFTSDLIGDFSIAKDLTTPLYNFAVVIDDAEMAISHVIRGEDHIPNTPRQLLLQEALGLAAPAYVHLPLILGPDRSKLSSRHGATAIHEYREQGYLPEALVNFMALLGWNPGGERELFSLAELITAFDLANVQKSGAAFNIEKLNWMNGEYIRRRQPKDLLAEAAPFLLPEHRSFPAAYVEKVITLEQLRLKKLSELKEASFFFTNPQYDPGLLRWKSMEADEIRNALQRALTVIEDTAESEFMRTELERRFFAMIGKDDRGEVLWPLRVALTGKAASPGPFEIMEVLGKERSATRIQGALAGLNG